MINDILPRSEDLRFEHNKVVAGGVEAAAAGAVKVATAGVVEMGGILKGAVGGKVKLGMEARKFAAAAAAVVHGVGWEVRTLAPDEDDDKGRAVLSEFSALA